MLAVGALLASVIYANSFPVSFQMDDFTSIVHNDRIKNLTDIPRIWEHHKIRFFTYLTFAVNYHLNGLDPAGYHLVNLLIHIGAGFSLFFLVLLLFKTEPLKKNPASVSSREIAFFTMLIFLSHPVQTQAVTYIVQRTASLAGMLYMAVCALYLQYRLTGKKPFYVAALLTALLGIFTKPNFITLPLMLAAIEFLFLKKDGFRAFRMRIVPFMIPVIFLIVQHPYFYEQEGSFSPFIREPGAPDPRIYFLTQLNVMCTYLRLLILPVHLNIDYDYPLSKSLLDPRTALSALLLAVVIAGAFIIRRRYLLLSFGCLWFFLTLSIESTVISLQDVIFEHRLYLPLAGFWMGILSWVYAVWNAPKARRVLLSGAVLIFSFLTYSRNYLWGNEVALWEDVVRKSPNKVRPYVNLAFSNIHSRQFERTIEISKKVLEMDPGECIAYHNIGVALAMKGEPEEAVGYFRKALEIKPNFVEAHDEMGQIYFKAKQYEMAIDHYHQALAIDPYNRGIYVRIAAVYQAMKDYENAITGYTKALEIDPRSAAAYNGLGYVYGETGDVKQAIIYYKKALALGGVSAQALSNLSNLCSLTGDFQNAFGYARRAIKIDPENAEAYNNLGIAYIQSAQIDDAIANFHQAVKYDPAYAKALNNLGAAYGEKGDFKKEIRFYKKALRVKPDYVEPYFNMGYSYERQGRITLAIHAYRKVVKMNPAHSPARQRLEALEKSV